MPVELQVIAYRIVQEALANVRAHAGAHHVAIWLETAGGSMYARVSDDGVGFLPGLGDRPPSPGMSSMREQATIAGGRWRVSSAPGMGTTVEPWLPTSVAGVDGEARSQNPTRQLPG